MQTLITDEKLPTEAEQISEDIAPESTNDLYEDNSQQTDGTESVSSDNEHTEEKDTLPDDSADESYYKELAEADLAELKSLFPELAMLKSITMLDDPLRYGALRDLGLSPSEAYLATCKRRRYDNRSHLTGLVPRSAAGSVYGMSASELESARELFGSLSDSEIQKLYKKVTR